MDEPQDSGNVDFDLDISKQLAELMGDGAWRRANPVIKSRESMIYRYVADDRKSVAVKRFKASANIQAARTQFDALSKYQGSMTEDTARFRVPKVYVFDTSSRFLIMEWVDGVTLHDALWGAFANAGARRELARRAGAWLRTFHHVHEVTHKPMAPKVLINPIEKQLRKIEPAHAGADPLFSKAFNRLKEKSKETASIPVTFASPHDDLTPTNMIISDKAIYGIDIWAREPRPVILDIARMIVYLTVAYPPLFGRLNLSKKTTCGAFLSGYGFGLWEQNTLTIKLAILSELLRRWIVIQSRPLTPKTMLTKSYQLMQLRRHVRQLIREIPRPA